MSDYDTKYDTRMEWYIHRDRSFCIRVVGWKKGEGWGWNVYATVFDSHPMYNNNDFLLALPLHGGCTLDEINTKQPFEIKYDFQRKSEWKTVGSDYAHLDDDYDTCSPLNGIPWQIELDAVELKGALMVSGGNQQCAK